MWYWISPCVRPSFGDMEVGKIDKATALMGIIVWCWHPKLNRPMDKIVSDSDDVVISE